MKKIYILAALLMATTSAHAGNADSIDIQGKRIEIGMAAADNSAPAPGPDVKHTNDEYGAEHRRPGSYYDMRFDDDDRASWHGRPGFEGGRRYYDDDRPSWHGRPGFEGRKRFNDDDRASWHGRPGFEGGRRFNDDDRDWGPRRPRFEGDRRFNDDDTYAGERPERSRYNAGYKSRRYSDDDNYASRPDRAPAALPVPAAPAPPAAPVVAATPPAQAEVAPAAPAPIRIVSTTPERQPAPVTAEPEPEVTSPVGTWATEDNKGNVRVERCGDSICGYSATSGEKVLINMKPQGSKWVGRVQEPDSGRKYDSTLTMKGNNSIRIQGCGFGGIFCSTQRWKRVS